MRQARESIAQRRIARGMLIAGVALIAAAAHAQAPETRKPHADPLPPPASMGAGSPAHVRVPPQRSCITGECHNQMGKAKCVHGPVAVGERTKCHVPRGYNRVTPVENPIDYEALHAQ